MKLQGPAHWGETLLPKWRGIQWTWGRGLLLAFAISLFVDSFLVPLSRDVDPGRAGDGVLFLILGFRAASRSDLPPSVVLAGGCLAALTLALNHGLLNSPSWIWTPIAIFLIVVVMFWGRGRRKHTEPTSPTVSNQPGS